MTTCFFNGSYVYRKNWRRTMRGTVRTYFCNQGFLQSAPCKSMLALWEAGNGVRLFLSHKSQSGPWGWCFAGRYAFDRNRTQLQEKQDDFGEGSSCACYPRQLSAGTRPPFHCQEAHHGREEWTSALLSRICHVCSLANKRAWNTKDRGLQCTAACEFLLTTGDVKGTSLVASIVTETTG